MRKLLLLPCLLILLGACERVSLATMTAVEQRRTANDMQARLTMAATCDISVGAYFRELNQTERQYAGLVCGGKTIEEDGLSVPVRLGFDPEGRVRLMPTLR